MSGQTEPLRTALQKITHLRPVGDVETCKEPRKLVKQMETIALRALYDDPPIPAISQLASKLTGRARFLRDRGEVKSPELMEEAARALSVARHRDAEEV